MKTFSKILSLVAIFFTLIVAAQKNNQAIDFESNLNTKRGDGLVKFIDFAFTASGTKPFDESLNKSVTFSPSVLVNYYVSNHFFVGLEGNFISAKPNFNFDDYASNFSNKTFVNVNNGSSNFQNSTVLLNGGYALFLGKDAINKNQLNFLLGAGLSFSSSPNQSITQTFNGAQSVIANIDGGKNTSPTMKLSVNYVRWISSSFGLSLTTQFQNTFSNNSQDITRRDLSGVNFKAGLDVVQSQIANAPLISETTKGITSNVSFGIGLIYRVSRKGYQYYKAQDDRGSASITTNPNNLPPQQATVTPTRNPGGQVVGNSKTKANASTNPNSNEPQPQDAGNSASFTVVKTKSTTRTRPPENQVPIDSARVYYPDETEPQQAGNSASFTVVKTKSTTRTRPPENQVPIDSARVNYPNDTELQQAGNSASFTVLKTQTSTKREISLKNDPLVDPVVIDNTNATKDEASKMAITRGGKDGNVQMRTTKPNGQDDGNPFPPKNQNSKVNAGLGAAGGALAQKVKNPTKTKSYVGHITLNKREKNPNNNPVVIDSSKTAVDHAINTKGTGNAAGKIKYNGTHLTNKQSQGVDFGKKINCSSPKPNQQFSPAEASQTIIFRWTPVVPKPQQPVTYRLKVWQLMQGQNGTTAMRTNKPIVTKDMDGITEASVDNLYTGPCRPPYLCDYIWIVQAIDNKGNVLSTSGKNILKVKHDTAKNSVLNVR